VELPIAELAAANTARGASAAVQSRWVLRAAHNHRACLFVLVANASNITRKGRCCKEALVAGR